jgi:outer membrane protein OmpA-like peptidoglycan-associated protein
MISMFIKKILVAMFILAFPFLLLSQNNYVTKKNISGKAKNYYEDYKEQKKKNELNRALKALEKCVEAEPTFIDGFISIGTLEYGQSHYAAAEAAFSKAMALSNTYEPLLYITLGNLQVSQRKNKEAVLNYEAFLATNSQNKDLIYDVKWKLRNARFAAFAKNSYDNPVPFVVSPLSDAINSKFPEYLPSFTLDEKQLVFTRRKQLDEDFYMSKKIDNVWQPAVLITEINTLKSEGAENISADGKLIVFAGCNRPDGFGDCDLYFSEFINGAWTKPANMGPIVNSKAWDSQPSLTSDGKTMYFSSSRPGSIGREDIWKTQKDSNGKWMIPTVLDSTINTTEHELTPYIHFDNQSLYFTSSGHPGMGGLDLFVAYKKANNTFGTPQNLGFPINTTADEANLIVGSDGKTAYFVTDRIYDKAQKSLANDKNGSETDIYTFELPEAVRAQAAVTYVRAKVYDAQTFKPILAKVEIRDIASNQLVTTIDTDRDGEFMTALPFGKTYGLNVNKTKYTFYSDYFELQATNLQTKPFELDIPLQPIVDVPNNNTNISTTGTTTTTAKPIVLKNIFFATASAVLKPESQGEIQALVQMLTQNPTLRIQLNGHTDNVGDDASNLTLSENRAKAVFDALVKLGIDPKRLRYKGFGKTQPIDSNDSPSGRQNNRRTEFVVF